MKNKTQILSSFQKRKGQVAVLIDPEKAQEASWLSKIVKRASFANVDYFFIGGSSVTPFQMEKTLDFLKTNAKIPTVIFPGDHHQVIDKADGLLYLSLLSGRNAEYLISQHVASAKRIFEMDQIEIIPTAYILIDGGTNSSVAYVSQTTPIPRDKTSIAMNTALAGILQGKSIVYFDAGSGAKFPVPIELIKQMNNRVPETPIIIGGGVKSVEEIENYKDAGANVIVIGNHIEDNIDFLLELNTYNKSKEKN